MSVACTDPAGRVFTAGTGMPTATGNWTIGLWVKISSYAAGQFTQAFSWNNNPTNTRFLGVDTGEVVNNTTLDSFIGTNITSEADSIATGSDTSWYFIACTHAAGTNEYIWYYRKQGDATLTTFTQDDLALELALTEISLFGSIFADPVATKLRSFFAQQTVMSSGSLLTASTSLSAPAGTNITVLPLDDHTTAGTNGGTGANWSTAGTLTTDAGDNPNPALPGGDQSSSLFFGAFP